MADREVDIYGVVVSFDKPIVIATSKVTTSDTVTIRSIASISARKVFKQSDLTELTTTLVTNVITVTTASLTDEPVIILAQE